MTVLLTIMAITLFVGGTLAWWALVAWVLVTGTRRVGRLAKNSMLRR
ncbi:MAG: hypothetical protein ACRDTS_16640 [Mycobacterium sp.]